jgi:hypothetical protein
MAFPSGQVFLRRAATIPSKPAPSSARLAGSGTALTAPTARTEMSSSFEEAVVVAQAQLQRRQACRRLGSITISV